MDGDETKHTILALQEHLQQLQRQLGATGDLMLQMLGAMEARIAALERASKVERKGTGASGEVEAVGAAATGGTLVPQVPAMVWSRREVQEADSAMRRLDTLEAAGQQAQGLELQEAVGLLAEVSVEHTRILRSFGRLLLALESDIH